MAKIEIFDDPEFGNWLAGFIDGEGCFVITHNRTSKGYACRFVLEVRDDDEAVLRDAIKITGAGYIRHIDRGRKGRTSAWRVDTKADCAKLAEFLDEYVLRAKKYNDFLIWRQALEAWLQAKPRGNDWSPFARWKQQLHDIRVRPMVEA